MLKKTIQSLAIGWTFLIAVLCLVKFTDLPTVSVSGADKYVHFTLHFVFTFLWGYFSWLKHNQILSKKIITVVLISLGYGILIEFLQETFTKTRHADVYDVLANASGAIMAFLVFMLLKKIKKA